MSFPRRFALVACVLLFTSASLFAQIPEPIENWIAPQHWKLVKTPDPEKESDVGRVPEEIEGVPTPALAFTGITPCRIADTRSGSGFTGPYGPPQISTAGRNIPLTGKCGIPAGAEAVSLNFHAANIAAPGFLVAYPAGSALPPVAVMAYNQNTPVISNSAVVPLGTGGAITVVAGSTNVDLIIDTNGYYAPEGGPGGLLPAGLASQTLRHNGTSWLATSALQNDGTTTTVNGVLRFAGSMMLISSGNRFLRALGTNLTVGDLSGGASMTGDGNTAIGTGALFSDTSGGGNTAIGFQALNNNSTGSFNTAVGYRALVAPSAVDNTAVGYRALAATTGRGNIALGSGAGINLTSGENNMYLGNEGASSEEGTIRIGSGFLHLRMFVAGVRSSAVSGSPVLISDIGQLGVAASSARYKEDIRDMGDSSAAILNLRPVTFRYKEHEGDPMQFGLIAEEVEKVLPELVTHNAAGEPETVMYHELPAMLLNEIQKQQRRIEWQDAEIAALRNELTSLAERLVESVRK